jgi:uncharacterized membrane protein (DUF373 family)
MRKANDLAAARGKWDLRWDFSALYQWFERSVIHVLTVLIAIIIALAVYNLAIKILGSLFLSSGFDPTDYAVFQTLFGMILTIIIALEFKRSLIVVAGHGKHVVQVRTVILIALLAIVRKLLILDLAATDAPQLFALAAAILALGGVHWLVRDQDRRDSDAETRIPAGAHKTVEGGDHDDEEARQGRVASISRPYVEGT